MKREAIETAYAWLSALTEPQVSSSPASGVWSPKQVLGHLVDSAANHHARWARMSGADGLTFPTWDQEAWMTAQDWQGRPWPELVALWYAYNLHLAWVAEHLMPAALAHTARVGTLNGGQPMTLNQLLTHHDTHVEHHLAQLRQRVGS